MALLNRFNGLVVPFASNSTGTNRTVFGDVTQSDDIDDNLNSDYKLGWEIVGASEFPTKQDFNAMAYTTSLLASYLYQQGIPEWNTSQEYYIGGLSTGSDGVIYSSATGTSGSPNTGTDPSSETDGSVWIIAANKYANLSVTHDMASDANYTLTALQNKYGRIEITDTGVVLTTGRDIVVDDREGRFLAVNSSLQTLTFKTSAGTGIAVPAGQTYELLCDGTNVIEPKSNNTGFKNLVINGTKEIQQRGTTGGTRQVIDAENVLISGSYTISFTGTATVRIYEATSLGATDALTTWSELTSGASSSGTTVTVTAGRYVKIEFSTTDFDFAQFEFGTVATQFEQENYEPMLSKCERYYQIKDTRWTFRQEVNATIRWTVDFNTRTRRLPNVSVSMIVDEGGATTVVSDPTDNNMALAFTTGGAGTYSKIGTVTIDAEHFTDTYYEDRWY